MRLWNVLDAGVVGVKLSKLFSCSGKRNSLSICTVRLVSPVFLGLHTLGITRSLMPHLTCHESRCNTRILLILKAEIFDYNGLFVHKYELSSPTDPNPQNVCVPFYNVLDWTVWACKWNGTHSRTLQPMFHHKLYIICRLMIWNMVFESAVRCTWNMFRLLFSSGIFSITAPLRSQLLSGRPCGKPGF